MKLTYDKIITSRGKKIEFFFFAVLCLQLCFASTIKLAAAMEEINPGLRTGQKMVYNPVEREIFLYGGNRGNGDNSLFESVWVYSVSEEKWSKITTEESPAARFNHGMVFLPENNSFLIFGGRRNSDYSEMGDTWKFDLSSNSWEEIITPTAPPARQFSSLCYDSQNERVLLFGGFGLNEVHTNDLWEFVVENNTWKEIFPVASPESRYGHSMVYRSAVNQTYMFAGRTMGLNNDLWEYNPTVNSWVSISTYPRPLQRYVTCIEYCPESDSLFLFGGDNSDTPGRALDDTWVYNFTANSWVELQPETSPPPRLIYSMCYDSTQEDIYVYGGLTDDYTRTLGDLWKFDLESENWSEVEGASDSTIGGYGSLGFILICSLMALTPIFSRKNKIMIGKWEKWEKSPF